MASNKCYTNPGTTETVETVTLTRQQTDANMLTVMRTLINGSGDVGGGMTAEIAAGFCGNFWSESRYNPTALGGKGNALGLAQWHPDRQKGLESLASSLGKSKTDIEVQAKYVLKELIGNEKGSWNVIKTANGVTSTEKIDDATKKVMDKYERSKLANHQNEAAYKDDYKKELKQRQVHAHEAYNFYMRHK